MITFVATPAYVSVRSAFQHQTFVVDCRFSRVTSEQKPSFEMPHLKYFLVLVTEWIHIPGLHIKACS